MLAAKTAGQHRFQTYCGSTGVSQPLNMSGIVVKSPIRRNVRRNSHGSRGHADKMSATSAETERSSRGTLGTQSMLDSIEMDSALSISLKKGSLTEADQQILDLIQQVPKKTSNPCLETFYLYPIAQRVYQAVTNKKLLSELGVYIQDKTAKRKIYQLVFDTLYHEEILEELLVESSFYSRYYHLHAHKALLLIMLFDFQSSKFTLRLRSDDEVTDIPETTVRVAAALWNHRTKLNATLARMRVAKDAGSITQLNSNPVVRKIYESNQLCPCYARVNTIKIRDVQMEVINRLINEGFVLVEGEEQLYKYSQTSMCLLEQDLLAFSSSCRGLLDTHELVESGCLVQQDMQSYRFVEGIADSIQMCSGDVVVTEANSGVEVAHIATILGYRGSVLVYNTQPTDIDMIQKKLLSLEVRNVRFMEMAFVCSSSDEDALEDVHMIICLSSATPSIVGNRVDYALQEGEQRLSAMLQPPVKVAKMTEDEHELFFHSLSSALNFHQVENIFLGFSSESNSKATNEAVIKQMLEQYNSKAEKIGLKNYLLTTTAHHSVHACDALGGRECFTTLIHREGTLGRGSDKMRCPDFRPEKPPPAPRTVINRAIEEGIIDGKGICDDDMLLKKKCRVKRRRSKHSIPAMTYSAQQKIVQKKEPKNEPKVFRF